MRLIDADKVKFKFPYGIDHNGILMVPYNSCKCSLDNAPHCGCRAGSAVPGVQVLCGIRCNHVLLHPSRWDEVYQRFRLLQPGQSP